MRDLTPRQLRVLQFIRGFVARKGFPPTYAEIAAGLKFRSPNAAREHVRLLAKKEALTVEPGLARSLRMAAPSGLRLVSAHTAPARDGDESTLPVIGEVAAGQPILAQANVERLVEVAPELFKPRADFFLRVRGDSMIDADLRPDDLLAIHRTSIAHDGQIAVVRLDDDVTVKRFRTRAKPGRKGGREIVLEPANRAHSPIVVDPGRVTVAIEGLVVGLLRTRIDGGKRS